MKNRFLSKSHLRYDLKKVSTPERVDLFLTDKCNQKCIFCYLYSEEYKPVKEGFSLEIIKKCLREGKNLGLNEVYITGGEPLSSKNFPSVVSFARDTGYEKIKVMTNGIRFSDKKYLLLIKDFLPTEIALSIHGHTEEVYDKNHGHRGGFFKLLKAIENLKNIAPQINLEVNTVATKYNIQSLFDFRNFVRSLEISRLHIQLLVPNSMISMMSYPDENEFSRAFKNLVDKNKDELKIDFAFVPYCLMEGYEDYIPRFDWTKRFWTNRPDMIEEWQRSLIKAKILKEKCKNCKYLQFCHGFWKH